MTMTPTLDADLTFGEWLRRQRGGLGLTQIEFARQLGCAPITLRKIKAEERYPSLTLAQRVAPHLHIAPACKPAFLRFARGELRAGAQFNGNGHVAMAMATDSP